MINQVELPEREGNVLNFILDRVDKTGIPPTLREIGKAVGITSTFIVSRNVKFLEEEGYLERRPHVARGLNPTSKARALVDKLVDGTLLRIPLYGSIRAGEPVQFVYPTKEDYNRENDILVDPRELPGGSAGLLALRVRGDSMKDAMICDEDIVVLQPVFPSERVPNGKMVAAWLIDENEMTLKYFFDEGDKIRLQPANDDYTPIYADRRNVSVQGKVVKVIRYH